MHSNLTGTRTTRTPLELWLPRLRLEEQGNRPPLGLGKVCKTNKTNHNSISKPALHVAGRGKKFINDQTISPEPSRIPRLEAGAARNRLVSAVAIGGYRDAL